LRIHFIGIGGMGLSALAMYFKSLGNDVSGSDVSSGLMVKKLMDHGVNVKIGHAHVDKSIDLIVKSSAVSNNDPEILQASELGIPVIDRMTFFAKYIKPFVGITGTDGKSSTTHMTAWIALKNRMDPILLCGAISRDLEDTNFRMGKGGIVAEVDESDPKMGRVRSEIACLTNLRYDHLERYGNDPKNQLRTIKEFLNNAHRTVVPDNFDFDASITFGKSGTLAFEKLNSTFSEQVFEVKYKGEKQIVHLPVPGSHQIYNALAAIGSGISMGISLKNCADALSDYPGLRRRLETLYFNKNVVVIDDYAHTPDEVYAAIRAVKPYFKKVTAIFEPHRYTRFVREYKKFAISLSEVDKIFVTDIFGAFEAGNANSNLLVEELKNLNTNAEFAKMKEIPTKLLKAPKSEAYLFMGAGEITNAAHEFAEKLEELKW